MDKTLLEQSRESNMYRLGKMATKKHTASYGFAYAELESTPVGYMVRVEIEIPEHKKIILPVFKLYDSPNYIYLDEKIKEYDWLSNEEQYHSSKLAVIYIKEALRKLRRNMPSE